MLKLLHLDLEELSAKYKRLISSSQESQSPPATALVRGLYEKELKRRGLTAADIQALRAQALSGEEVHITTKEKIRTDVRPERQDLVAGVAWCVFFKRQDFLSSLWVRDLRHAYRAPSLFAATLREAGCQTMVLSCDEQLLLADVDGTRLSMHEEADIFYIASHGKFEPAGYTLLLHKEDWLPGGSKIGSGRLSVAVFDTCFLVDSSKSWSSIWSSNILGSSLRLLLGFDGLAAMDRGSSLRGKAFAELLAKGRPIAESWIKAVHQTATSVYDIAVAIGVGDNENDARTVLETASIDNMPPPRTGAIPTLVMKR